MEVYKNESEQDVPLSFASASPETWAALGALPRTGWVNRGIENPETVQEHTIALMRLAASIDGLTDQERDGLVAMLEVHDWPEAKLGDEVILTEDDAERARLKASKSEREVVALELICANLGSVGQTILELWHRFESSQDPAAVFARQLDKYQAVERALEYERTQGKPIFKDFCDYSKKFISHPIILGMLAKLEADWKS